MPDPSYVLATAGKQVGLSFHLETAFYPPVPQHIRTAMMAAFTEYWRHEIDVKELEEKLRGAGYIGGLHNYNFWQFLNEEDLH